MKKLKERLRKFKKKRIGDKVIITGGTPREWGRKELLKPYYLKSYYADYDIAKACRDKKVFVIWDKETDAGTGIVSYSIVDENGKIMEGFFGWELLLVEE